MIRGRVHESARRWGLAAVAAVLALALTAACGSGNGGGEPLSVGDTAPAFTAPASDGGNVTLTNLASGKDAVVVVFYRGFG